MRVWKPSRDWGDAFVEHQGEVCESTNLACTQLPPLTYQYRHPELHSHGKLSTFQYETVGYACQSLHRHRAFLLGDATGSGKSRVIAGILREMLPQRVVWVSINTRLRAEAQKEVNCLNAPYAFTACGGAVFLSYASLHNQRRLNELVSWLASADSLLILDEAHCCRNESATFAATQRLLDAAHNVVYSTATFASSLKHMRYLSRLHIWGPGTAFYSFEDFVMQMRTHGTVVLELLSVQLKLLGKAVSRQISFQGVHVDLYRAPLNDAETRLYNASVDLFANAQMHFFQKLITRFKTRHAVKLARDALARGMSVVISLQSTGEAAARRGMDACMEMLHGAVLPSAPPAEPLATLLHEFGDVGVAEVSGRTTRDAEAAIARFQSGQARVILITRAGSTGISLHDTNGFPRLHILMELPWSSEDFLQQAGRTHRTGQLSAPTYVILTSSVPGEARFVNCVAQRVASLGALTYGDRTVTISPLAMDTPGDWGVPARRLAALELWIRNAQSLHIAPEPLPDDLFHMLPRVSRTAEIYAFQQVARHETQRLEHTPPTLTQGQLYTLVMRVCPVARTWMPHTWSREAHYMFAGDTRKCIETVLLAATRVECAHTLGALPTVLLEEILRHYASDPLNLTPHANDVLRRLDNLNLPFAQFCTASCEYVQNRILSLPIQTQRCCINAIVRCARDHRVPECHVRDFEQYIAREGLTFECTRASVVSVQAPNDAVRLDMRAEAVAYPDPGPFPVMLDQITRLVCKVDVSDTVHIYYATGKHVVQDRRQWDYVQLQSRFVDTEPIDWETATFRAFCTRKSRATRVSRSYVFVVHDALRCWNVSKHLVVRVPGRMVASVGVPGFVGVLM